MLAVGLVVGLLVVGGVALWGALTSKDGSKNPSAQPSASVATKSKPAGKPTSGTPANPVGNTVELHCLAAQCQVFVAGPGPTDVQFNGNLAQNERRVYNETQLTVVVADASSVAVTINGHQQVLGKHGQPKTYEVPAPN